VLRSVRSQRSRPWATSTRIACILCITFLLPSATSTQLVSALDQSVSVPDETAEKTVAIPPNFLTPILRPVIETMWHQSPTFKAQCARLRAAPSLLAEIRLGSASQLGSGRGRTDFVRSSRDTARAIIYINLDLRSVDQLIELIAHELEHVIEQLDEVELTPSDRHGVYLTATGAFETARAIHIGQKVSREVYGATYSGPTLRRR
jgi:hypothetical protein